LRRGQTGTPTFRAHLSRTDPRALEPAESWGTTNRNGDTHRSAKPPGPLRPSPALDRGSVTHAPACRNALVHHRPTGPTLPREGIFTPPAVANPRPPSRSSVSSRRVFPSRSGSGRRSRLEFRATAHRHPVWRWYFSEVTLWLPLAPRRSSDAR
jgi:hypothetical protein